MFLRIWKSHVLNARASGQVKPGVLKYEIEREAAMTGASGSFTAADVRPQPTKGAVMFTFELIKTDGTLADPPQFVTVIPNWHEGETFMLRPGRVLRIIRIRSESGTRQHGRPSVWRRSASGSTGPGNFDGSCGSSRANSPRVSKLTSKGCSEPSRHRSANKASSACCARRTTTNPGP